MRISFSDPDNAPQPAIVSSILTTLKVVFVVFIITLAVNIPSVHAVTYYIDYQSGTDSNNGTSPATPWKHCPGDESATHGPAGTELTPGDKILFRSGSVYVGEITLKTNGNDGNPLIFDGGSWGSGPRCVVTTSNTMSGRTAFNVADKSHLIFQNFEIADCGGYSESDEVWATTNEVASPPSGNGFSIQSGGSHIVISNIFFREIGQWQNKKPMSGVNSVNGTGISLKDNTNILIVDCEFTRMKTGVSVKASTTIDGITILRCSFHNYMNWLIDIAPRSAGATLQNITIDGCTLYNYKEFDTPNWQGYGEKPHQDGIFLRTSGMHSTWTNIVIRNTTFYSDDSSNGGTASIYLSQGSSADIYNCVFLNDHHSNAYINVGYNKLTGMYQQIRVWNCTFIGSSRAFKVSPDNTNPDVVVFKNNLVYRTTSSRNGSSLLIGHQTIGRLEMDANLYFADYSPLSEFLVANDGAYRTLESWQKATGQEKNSILANPKLSSLVGAASTWDVRPTLASPLLGAALDLGALFSTDLNGTSRTAHWDIGAYQFTPAPGDIIPPRGLRIMPQ